MYNGDVSPQGDIRAMTERELKKLSRLELLELLLEASTENQALKERIEKLTVELQMAEGIQQLSETTRQVESALKYANNLTAWMKAVGSGGSADRALPSPEFPDAELYRHILRFFANNRQQLSALPLELQVIIEERIKAL